jgi:hypothetical protein
MSILKKEKIEETIEAVADKFEEYYLDWVNDFLTVQGYADFYAIPESEAKQRIDIGRKIHKQRHC